MFFPLSLKGAHALFWVVCVVFGSMGPACGEEKLVALAGNGYGATEVKAIGKWLGREAEFAGLVLEQENAKPNVLHLDRFKMMILASFNDEEPYSPEECEAMLEWIRGGGKLLLIHHAPQIFQLKPGTAVKPDSYLFGQSLYLRAPTQCEVDASAALLKGVFSEDESPSWLEGNLRIAGADWVPLIWDDQGRCLAGWRKIGTGKVYYLGNELFRIESRKNAGETAAWKQLLHNVLADGLQIH